MKKFLVILVLQIAVFAQLTAPKREMRGVWIATVANIDWPSKVGSTDSTIQQQKNELIKILDLHKSCGINSVFFQVRTTCDAFYKSPIEPWSVYLTGKQGLAPSDNTYDPLEFAIKEAHKRGIELHAWLNPYRAFLVKGDTSKLSATHVIKRHPEWIIKCDTTQYRFLNPGLPEVREYVKTVVEDIIKRYDVDGIHFDDYFYPYKEYGNFNDDETFKKYPAGFADKTEWRKNNVNLLVKMLHDSIRKIKPYVKYGISPFGISPNSGVNVLLGCNPVAWLSGEYIKEDGKKLKSAPYVDYILPQLYWPLETHYIKSLPNWTAPEFLNGRHLYIGHSTYLKEAFQVPHQIKIDRIIPPVSGSVFWSSQWLVKNQHKLQDSLKNFYYKNPSLLPTMPWISKSTVQQPKGLKAKQTESGITLSWNKVSGNDWEKAYKYVIYRSESPNIDVSVSKNIIAITNDSTPSYKDSNIEKSKTYYYTITALDRISNESKKCKEIKVIVQ